MDIYKKMKKGRKKQVQYIYDAMAENEHPCDDENEKYGYNHLTVDRMYMLIDSNWKNIFPIQDTLDANKVCKGILNRILNLDSLSIVSVIDLITVYSYLFYLENYINQSIIQNSDINNKYSFIKEYLYRFETGLDYIKIKY